MPRDIIPHSFPHYAISHVPVINHIHCDYSPVSTHPPRAPATGSPRAPHDVCMCMHCNSQLADKHGHGRAVWTGQFSQARTATCP